MKHTEKNLPENIRVWVRHHKGTNGRLLWTSCQLVDTANNDYVVAYGEAFVSKKEKHPSKKIGRAVAVGRAVKQFHSGGIKAARLDRVAETHVEEIMVLGPAFTAEPFTTPREK